MNTSDVQAQKRRYGIVGNSEGLNHAVDIALQVAKTDLSVLITGESGVGKEIIPRIIHDNSLRKTKKYFAVNCGSIPEGTIDSELFGHEKGAFTGAIGEREGYFGAANGGTLFLDEVGELPLATQARLLRVLETGEYIRVGSSDVRKTDVRIVAATNVNMAQAIRDGRFREDLLYRISVVPLMLPPLRERRQDIIPLVQNFMEHFCRRYNQLPFALNQEETAVLRSYDWPGNIRELKNVIERAVILNAPLLELVSPSRATASGSEAGAFIIPDFPTIPELEERYLRYVLERTGGKVCGPDGAESLLRLKRSTIYLKLKKYGIRP